MEGQYQRANLYVLLIGPPATGKSNALKVAHGDLLTAVKALHLAPTDVTREAFYDVLEGSVSSYNENGEMQVQSSIVAFLDEWAVFVRKNDEPFTTFLADIYDNPNHRDYWTKARGNQGIEFPNFTMAGGVTMKQLRERFTDQALEGGFPSRIIMVYSDTKIDVPMGLRRVGDNSEDAAIRLNREKQSELCKELVHDLEAIMVMEGEYRWTDEAAGIAEMWKEAGMPPVPPDPRLTYYCERRMAHFTKLCMVLSAGRRDDLIITGKESEDAKQVLIDVERWMPHAMSALGANEYYNQLQFGRDVVIAYCKMKGKTESGVQVPCPEWFLRQELAQEVPIYQVNVLLENLVKMRWIDIASRDPLGDPDGPVTFIPGVHRSDRSKAS